jgi:hypothetical protein
MVTVVFDDEALTLNACSIFISRPSSVPCCTPRRWVEFSGV